jgi:hypothetical protein
MTLRTGTIIATFVRGGRHKYPRHARRGLAGSIGCTLTGELASRAYPLSSETRDANFRGKTISVN